MSSRASEDSSVELRALVSYGPDGVEIVRMSDQLTENGPRDGTLELIQSITGTDLPDEPFGRRDASVHRFQDVTVVHCPDDEGGRVGTFDAAAANHPLETLVERVIDA